MPQLRRRRKLRQWSGRRRRLQKRCGQTGRFIVLALVTVVDARSLRGLRCKGESEKMSIDDVAKERKAIYLLPKAEQIPRWKTWAARPDVPALQQEAFGELAWAKDPDGMKMIVGGLTSDDHRDACDRPAAALLECTSTPEVLADGAEGAAQH